MSAFVCAVQSRMDYQPGSVRTRRDTVGVDKCVRMKVSIN